jgi:Ribbon-helix-helix protein, copG family
VISSDIFRRAAAMTDLLIRDVPDEVLAAIDSNATRLGLSRAEYLRRALARAAHQPGVVSVEQLIDFGETFKDLANEDLMRGAWT